MPDIRIGLVGNPNCGKTSLFNALTGDRQITGNWPGVTVQRKAGFAVHGGHQIELLDLPGLYSMDACTAGSLDERVAREYLYYEKPDVIINVLDANNLERNLYLTIQLLELGLPMVVALNRIDLARQNGWEINSEDLARLLDCPVVEIVATRQQGLDTLLEQAVSLARNPVASRAKPHYSETIQHALEVIELESAEVASARGLNSYWLAIKLLEEDEDLLQVLEDPTLVKKQRIRVEKEMGEEADVLVADGRYQFIAEIVGRVRSQRSTQRTRLSSRLDNLFLNRWLGLPLFLLVMYLLFMVTINVGGAFIDFFDLLAGTLLVDAPTRYMEAHNWPQWLVVLLPNGVGAGIQTVATFIPVIGFLFLFLSLLEESGYMMRVAFVMDRLMQRIGLPGKAFVPLVVGFGCNVPAVMATRTLEARRDRLMTMMMAPFMSCGARLSVYALFAAAFFPVHGQDVVFLLYLLGILFAVMTAWLMKGSLLQGRPQPFVMELPEYQLPGLRTVLQRTWMRLNDFLFGAGKLIVIMVLVINLLASVDTQGQRTEAQETSVLSHIGQAITPAFAPMGIEQDNWPATVGLFVGVLAKEVVVGALDAMYTTMVEAQEETVEEEASLVSGIAAAFASIGPNLAAVADQWLDPLGMGVGDIMDETSASEAQGVNASIFGIMAQRFDGAHGAFAYLLFILLYFPCVSVMGAIAREGGLRWAVFAAVWTTTLAYSVAVVYYQSALLIQGSGGNLLWPLALAGIWGAVFFGLRLYGKYLHTHLQRPSFQ